MAELSSEDLAILEAEGCAPWPSPTPNTDLLIAAVARRGLLYRLESGPEGHRAWVYRQLRPHVPSADHEQAATALALAFIAAVRAAERTG